MAKQAVEDPAKCQELFILSLSPLLYDYFNFHNIVNIS